MLVVAKQMHDLFGALEAKIHTADHQKRRHQPWRECVQEQCCGQQDHQLVEDRATRNLPHDRQFTRSRQVCDIFRRDGRVIDHDTNGLGSSLGGIVNHRRRDLRADLGRLPGNIVNLSRSQFGDCGNVVQ